MKRSVIIITLILFILLLPTQLFAKKPVVEATGNITLVAGIDLSFADGAGRFYVAPEILVGEVTDPYEITDPDEFAILQQLVDDRDAGLPLYAFNSKYKKITELKVDIKKLDSSVVPDNYQAYSDVWGIGENEIYFTDYVYLTIPYSDPGNKKTESELTVYKYKESSDTWVAVDTLEQDTENNTISVYTMDTAPMMMVATPISLSPIMMAASTAPTSDYTIDYSFDTDKFYENNLIESVDTASGTLILNNKDFTLDCGPLSVDFVRQFNSMDYYLENPHEGYPINDGWEYELPYIPNTWRFNTKDDEFYNCDGGLFGLGSLLNELTNGNYSLYEVSNMYDDMTGYISKYNSTGSGYKGYYTLVFELKREKIVWEVDAYAYPGFLWIKTIKHEGSRAIMPDGTIYHFGSGTGRKRVSRITDEVDKHSINFSYDSSGRITSLKAYFGTTLYREITFTRTGSGDDTTELIKQVESNGTTYTNLVQYVQSYDTTNQERTFTKKEYIDNSNTLDTVIHIEDQKNAISDPDVGTKHCRDITITYPTLGESRYSLRELYGAEIETTSSGNPYFLYVDIPRVETHTLTADTTDQNEDKLVKTYNYFNSYGTNLINYTNVTGASSDNFELRTNIHSATIEHAINSADPFYKKKIEYKYNGNYHAGPDRIRHYAPEYSDYINETGNSYASLKGSYDFLELSNISSYQTLVQYKLEKYDYVDITDDYNEPKYYYIFYTDSADPDNSTAVTSNQYDYDTLGQLIAEKDTLSNVTEYFYIREADRFSVSNQILNMGYHEVDNDRDPYDGYYGTTDGSPVDGQFWRFGIGKPRAIIQYEDYEEYKTVLGAGQEYKGTYERYYQHRQNYGLINEEQELYFDNGVEKTSGTYYVMDATLAQIIQDYAIPSPTGCDSDYMKNGYFYGTSGNEVGRLTRVRAKSEYIPPEGGNAVTALINHYYEYDELGNVVEYNSTFSDGTNTENSARVFYDYDTLGRLKQVDYNDGSTTNYKKIQYTKATSSTKASMTIINAVGEITYYEYDGLNRLILEEQYIPTDGAGSINSTKSSNATLIKKIEYVYHPYNSQTPAVTKVYGNTNVVQTTEHLFDCEGRILKTYVNGDFVSETKVNESSRITKTFYVIEDASTNDEVADIGLKVITDYDENGNVVAQWKKETATMTTAADPIERVEYVYDGLGHLITEKKQVGTDQSSNPIYYQIDYEYTTRGDLLETTYPDNTSETATYDVFGRVETVTDRVGNEITNVYNGFNRLLKASIEDENEIIEQTSRTYYGLDGKVFQQTLKNGTGTTLHDSVQTYDALGRLTTTQQWLGNPTNTTSYTQTFSYDAIGSPLSMELKKGSTVLETISYTPGYDYNHTGFSAPTGIDYSVWNSGVDISGLFSTDIGHYWWGGRSHIDYDFSTSNTIIGYDSIDTKLLVPTEIKDLATVNPIYNLTYTYDDAGNILTMNDNGTSESFSYNGLGRIISETRSGTTYNYSYDMLGNRLNFQTGTPTSATYAYDSTEKMQLNSMSDAFYPSTSFTYDDNGSMTQKNDGTTTWNYSYDASGNMISASDGTNTSTYAYGPNGLRFKKVEGGKTTYYLYSGNDILMEEVYNGNGTANTGTPESRTIFINFEGSSLGAIETYDFTTNPDSKRVVSYLLDHIGSRKEVINSSGGVIANRDVSYYPFGEMKSGGSQDDYRFTNKEMDSTGLDYFNARYYDPTIGRFISIDPIKDGLNWYMYCGNNPLIAIDINGLETVYLGFCLTYTNPVNLILNGVNKIQDIFNPTANDIFKKKIDSFTFSLGAFIDTDEGYDFGFYATGGSGSGPPIYLLD